MIIAVDFDGTIVEHRYPEIGKELPFACATLKQLLADGHKLVLWSVREGKLLEDAVNWCRERGVTFYAVNQNFDEDAPEREKNDNYSRKLKAHCFIDDRNVGGMLDWGLIYQLISRRVSLEEYMRNGGEIPEPEKKKKRGFWPF